MTSLVIHEIIKIVEWMKHWCESVPLTCPSPFDTKTNIKVMYEFSVCFLYSSRKDQFILPLCLADYYEAFCEYYTIRFYPNFVHFPTVISTNKTGVRVMTWKQHKYGSKTFCGKIFSRHVQLLFKYFLECKKTA